MSKPTRLPFLLGLALLVQTGLAQSGPTQTLGGAVQAPANTVTLADSNAARSFDCAGHSVTIAGSHSSFTLTGRCNIVNVTGSQDTIRLNTARVLQLLGNDDVVSWNRRPQYVFIHAGTSGNRAGPAE